MAPRLAALFAVLGACPLWAQKSTSVRLDSGSAPGAAPSTFPVLAAEGTKLYVAWIDGRTDLLRRDVWFNRSLDGGDSWLASDVRLDLGSAAGATRTDFVRPALAAQDLVLCVAWAEWRAARPDIHLNRSLDAGATWLPSDVRVNLGTGAGTSAARDPRVVVRVPDVFVLWRELLPTPGLWVNHSPDSGANFAPQSVRVDHGVPVEGVLGLAGPVQFALWTDTRDARDHGGSDGIDERDVYFNRSLDGGATWQPADVRLDRATLAGDVDSGTPAFAVSGSNLFVAWVEGASVRFNRSSDGGATWLAADVARDPTSDHPNVDVLLVAFGTDVHLLWADQRESPGLGLQLTSSNDAGVSWSAPRLLADHAASPGLARLGGRRIAAAWFDSRHGSAPGFRADVFYNRSLDGGASWLAEDVRLNVGDAPGSVAVGAVALASDYGSSFVVWQSSGPAPGIAADIHFNLAQGGQNYASGSTGTGGLAPKLRGATPSALGEPFSFGIFNARGGANALLIGGSARDAMPFAGGVLLVRQPWSFRLALVLQGAPGAAGAGEKLITQTIPADLALLGTAFDLQALVLDPDAVGGVALSQGLEVWIL